MGDLIFLNTPSCAMCHTLKNTLYIKGVSQVKGSSATCFFFFTRLHEFWILSQSPQIIKRFGVWAKRHRFWVNYLSGEGYYAQNLILLNKLLNLHYWELGSLHNSKETWFHQKDTQIISIYFVERLIQIARPGLITITTWDHMTLHYLRTRAGRTTQRMTKRGRWMSERELAEEIWSTLMLIWNHSEGFPSPCKLLAETLAL